MKILFDTNVLISAIITNGRSAEVLKLCLMKHTVVTSNYILEELEEKLVKKFHYSVREAATAKRVLLEQAVIVTPILPVKNVCRDPDDDNILAAALDGMCDCIISGDKDLLVLSPYQGIPILKPTPFIEWERSQIP